MKKKKNLRKVILFIILLLIVLIIFLTFLNKKASKIPETISEEFRYSLKPDEEVEKLSEDTIIANNSYKFFLNYYKKIDAKDIQENWDKFTRIVVPKYTENVTSAKDIKNYYNSNKEDILLDTGIDNEKDFELLVQKITFKYTKKLNKLKSIDILNESKYDKKNKITNCKMKAVYDDNIEIEFDFKVFNEKSLDKGFIIYE